MRIYLLTLPTLNPFTKYIMLIIKEISFDAILTVWKNQLWPGRLSPIEPFSAMRFMGEYSSNFAKLPQVFLGGYQDNKLVAVNSLHLAEKYMARSRGLWVDSNFRGAGFGTKILIETGVYAKELGADAIWSFPRQSSITTYKSAGYIQISHWLDDGEFGPNCYAISPLA